MTNPHCTCGLCDRPCSFEGFTWCNRSAKWRFRTAKWWFVIANLKQACSQHPCCKGGKLSKWGGKKIIHFPPSSGLGLPILGWSNPVKCQVKPLENSAGYEPVPHLSQKISLLQPNASRFSLMFQVRSPSVWKNLWKSIKILENVPFVLASFGVGFHVDWPPMFVLQRRFSRAGSDLSDAQGCSFLIHGGWSKTRNLDSMVNSGKSINTVYNKYICDKYIINIYCIHIDYPWIN